MKTKKHMVWAAICLIMLALVAGTSATVPKFNKLTVVPPTPTYSTDPPMPGGTVTAHVTYVLECPPLSGGGCKSIACILAAQKAYSKIGKGSYQIASVSPASCTIQCPQPTPPVTCDADITITIPAGSDCQALVFQFGGSLYPTNKPTASVPTYYQSKAIQIGSSAGACATGIEEEAEEDESGPIASGTVFDPDQTFRCADLTGDAPPPGFPGCSDDFRCVAGSVTNEEPIVRCKDCGDCKKECAKACGTNTNCVKTPAEDCKTCCEDTTCSKAGYIKYEFWTCLSTTVPIEQEACSCLNACQGECEANTSFCNAINIMRLLALISAAILLAIHGLRLIMSEEPEDRKNAKESIWFVILGTLIIFIASGLVGYLYVGGVIC